MKYLTAVSCRCLATLHQQAKTVRTYCRQSKVKEKPDSVYSTEETENILSCLNKSTRSELVAKLSEENAERIVKYRDCYGHFSTLGDLLKVPRLGKENLKKMCNDLKAVNYESLIKLSEKFYAVQSLPAMTNEMRMSVSSLVALDLHIDCITWVHMSRDLTVHDWRQVQLFKNMYIKNDLAAFQEKLCEVIKLVPEASIYTLERKNYRYQNLRIVPYIINLRTIEAMFVALLNRNYLETGIHKVFMIKPHDISELFDLKVGSEIVSGQPIVWEIIKGYSKKLASSVHVPGNLATSYFREDSIQKEKFAACFLQAVAFYNLIILNK